MAASSCCWSKANRASPLDHCCHSIQATKVCVEQQTVSRSSCTVRPGTNPHRWLHRVHKWVQIGLKIGVVAWKVLIDGHVQGVRYSLLLQWPWQAARERVSRPRENSDREHKLALTSSAWKTKPSTPATISNTITMISRIEYCTRTTKKIHTKQHSPPLGLKYTRHPHREGLHRLGTHNQ